MRKFVRTGLAAALTVALAGATGTALASSHMDAPLITLDPAANTTDVYAFVTERDAQKRLVVALATYPFEFAGIGPHKYNFDDDVRYSLNLSLGEDVAAGRTSISYVFDFTTRFKNESTVLQSYLGIVENVDDEAQNLTQDYTVTRIDRRGGNQRANDIVTLGGGLVPPNNQGVATPFYNQGDNGENPAKNGVGTLEELDRYTQQSVVSLERGYRAFAGQRDDGFFGDIQAVFDLLQLRNPGVDAQAGFNIHLIALEIPLADIVEDDLQLVGVHATTSRRRFNVLSSDPQIVPDVQQGRFVQVARQGNPLFNEGLVAIADSDLYSRTTPQRDAELFSTYALTPELAALLNALVVPGTGLEEAVETERTDIAGIYIPDLIKVDLSTPAVRLAGNGPHDPLNPDDEGFSALSIFGDDVVQSQIQDPFGNGGLVPGGWPNGRRFGDDVVDIAVSALLSDLRSLPLFIQVAGDNVNGNDTGFNKVFPYESTPQNGRTSGRGTR
ncbi:MAG: DUF4331 domain-containing protein [Pseudomonadota bacterium]